MNAKKIRADPKFNKEIQDIKKKRVKGKIDKKETTTKKITGLIPKHKSWKNVKEDIINDKTIRVDPSFNNEIEEIKQKRVDSGMDYKKIPTRIITALIAKHKSWWMIKEDLINKKLDKRGII